MADLAELPAKFYSAGMTRFRQESQGEGKDLAQPGTFTLTGSSYPVLPPSIQEFISDACSIPLPLIKIIWKYLAFYSWNMELDISPASNLNLPSIYAKYGHSRGISKN